MAFDWQEYLRLARFLEAQPGNGFAQEAALRTAVSRAYYAAFCHARNYARDQHGFRPTGGAADHKLVRKHFRARNEAAVASAQDTLRQLRNTCDYDDMVRRVARKWHRAAVLAEQVLERLK